METRRRWIGVLTVLYGAGALRAASAPRAPRAPRSEPQTRAAAFVPDPRAVPRRTLLRLREETCFVLDGGVLRCVEDPSTTYDESPLPAASYDFPGLPRLRALSPLFVEDYCAVAEDDTVWCTGDGALTEAQRQQVPARRPALVPGIADALDVVGVASRYYALHRDGGLSRWGPPLQGAPLAPSRIPSVQEAVQLAGARFFACVLLRDGSARCWGAVPFATATEDPVAVPGLARAVALAVSARSLCAQDDRGAVRCWRGRDEAPHEESFLQGVSGLTGGDGSVCGVDPSGAVRCLDERREGPQVLRRERTLRLPEGRAVAVSVGTSGVCARGEDGPARCWIDPDAELSVDPSPPRGRCLPRAFQASGTSAEVAWEGRDVVRYSVCRDGSSYRPRYCLRFRGDLARGVVEPVPAEVPAREDPLEAPAPAASWGARAVGPNLEVCPEDRSACRVVTGAAAPPGPPRLHEDEEDPDPPRPAVSEDGAWVLTGATARGEDRELHTTLALWDVRADRRVRSFGVCPDESRGCRGEAQLQVGHIAWRGPSVEVFVPTIAPDGQGYLVDPRRGVVVGGASYFETWFPLGGDRYVVRRAPAGSLSWINARTGRSLRPARVFGNPVIPYGGALRHDGGEFRGVLGEPFEPDESETRAGDLVRVDARTGQTLGLWHAPACP